MNKITSPAFRRNPASTAPTLTFKKAHAFLRDDTNGAVAVLTALMLPVLIGITGLAVDTALWMGNKSTAQGASDNAGRALLNAVKAGATTSQAIQIAYDVAAADGYKNNVGGVTVAVTGPTSGLYLVRISQPQSLFFSSLALPTAPTVAVQTSVQTASSAGSPCITALDGNNDKGTLTVAGNATVNTSGCIIDNKSSNSAGTVLQDASSILTASEILTPGGVSGNFTGQVVNGPVTDPLAGLAVPSAGTCSASSFAGTVSPGTYCGNIKIQNTTSLSPGTYIFNGGTVTLNAGGVLSGTGVTLVFINGATFDINGTSTLNLTAPTSGTYQGVAIFDASTGTGTFDKINGNANVTINGAVYAPYQTVTYIGTATAACTKLIAYQVSFSGTSSFKDDGTCVDPPSPNTQLASGIY